MPEDSTTGQSSGAVAPDSPSPPGQGHANESSRRVDASGTYYAEFDPRDDDIALEVLFGLEAVTGRDATDLPPITEFVDPDALNELFRSGRSEGSVRFTVPGYGVAVHSDGRLVITPEDEEA